MKISQKGIVVFSTLIVIALAFAYYFFVYVANNERAIIADNMRVLGNIKGNIENLIDNQIKILKNSGKLSDSLEYDYDYIDLGLHFRAEKNVDSFEVENDTTDENSNSLQEDVSYKVIFENPLVLRKDIFDFISVSQIDIDSMGVKNLQSLFTSNPTYGNFNIEQDSIIKAFQTKKIFDADLGIANYKAFNLLISPSGKPKVFVTGFVQKERFDDQTREVSVFIISLAVILTIMTILALPILKLFVMSNLERLEIKDVFFIGASVAVIPMAIILLTMFLVSQISYVNQTAKDELNDLHIKIERNFEDEIENVLNFLGQINSKGYEDWDSFEGDSISNWISNFDKINENSFFNRLDRLDKRFQNDTSQNALNWKDAEEGTYWSFVDINFDKLKSAAESSLDTNFRYYNSMFWLDEKGSVKIYISSEKEPIKFTDLSHRKYVMDVANGEANSLHGKDFVFESIRSVTDGNYEIGLGIPSKIKGLEVFATSFSSASLMDPILKPGFGFCLFDETGKTLLHSEKERNLNENFLEETKGEFIPFVSSGSNHYASVKYMGRPHNIFVQKLKNIDGYYLATFVDNQYEIGANAMAINLTLELQLGYLSLILLIFLIVSLFIVKSRKLKQKVFLFNWLRPYLEPDAYYYKTYLYLLYINILGLVYYLIEWGVFLENPIFIIHDLLLVGISILSINYFVLSQSLPNSKKIYTLFVNNRILSNLKIAFTILIMVLIMDKIVLISSLSINGGITSIIFLILIAYFVGALLFRLKSLQNQKDENPNTGIEGKIWMPGEMLLERLKDLFGSIGGQKLYKSYLFYIFSLITLITIVPTLIFFSISYNLEQRILYQHNAQLLVSNYENWEGGKKQQFVKTTKLSKSPKITFLDDFVESMAQNKNDLIYPSEDIKLLSKVEHVSDTSTLNNGFYDLHNTIFSTLRIPINPYGKSSKGFLEEVVDQKKFDAQKSAYQIVGKLGTYSLNSMPKNFIAFVTENCWVLILVGLFILIPATFMLLSGTSRKLFGIKFKSYTDDFVLKSNSEIKAKQIDDTYKYADQWINSSGNNAGLDSFNNTLLIGINANHIRKVYEQLKESYKENFFYMDMNELPSVFDPEKFSKNESKASSKFYFQNSFRKIKVPIEKLIQHDSNPSSLKQFDKLVEVLKNTNDSKNYFPNKFLIYFDHFDLAYDDIELNRARLCILQYLVSNPMIRLVAASSTSPENIYEYYEDLIENYETGRGSSEENANTKLLQIKRDYRLWIEVLGNFYTVNIPLENSYLKEAKLSKTLKSEFNHGRYLQKLYFIRNYPKHYRDEDIILQIQKISSTYYYEIWNGLTKGERYIVYDIAKDKFVNTNNVDGIINLLNKGILIFDHSLRLMNESFTNFVLSKVDRNEAIARELESKQKGTWNITLAVLLLLIISMLVFISFGRIHVLNDINTVITSAGAAMALLLRLGGLFAFTKLAK